MREINFRVWNKNEKTWYYQDDLILTHYGIFEGYHTLSNNIPIENAEIMQYTGLKDVNGREIYEGDILLGVKDYKTKPLHIWWDKEECFYNLSLINGFNVKKLTKNNVIKAEIIGNIYEHSHLSEGN